MTKKEFMIQVIDFLPDWKMGRGLKALIQNDQLSAEVFEKLYDIFRQGVMETYDEVKKVQLKQRLREVEALRTQEEQDSQNEIIDLEQMLEHL